jgi:hypothetical protein
MCVPTPDDTGGLAIHHWIDAVLHGQLKKRRKSGLAMTSLNPTHLKQVSKSLERRCNVQQVGHEFVA